jgi:CheY-like chemotaxis protein
VAHDFNNLLTVVLGNLELLSMRAAGERDRRLIEGALQAGQRGAKLNQQLLAFSREQRLAPKPTDVNLLINETTELLARTLGGRVEVKAELSGNLWPALVDPTQLETAILNLAINARDAMPDGGTLSLATANVAYGAALPADLPPGEYVALSVADTGAGMSEEVLARVFEPFFTTKEVGKGSGLGLSQVYGFVKQSGGTVTIESRPGQGTTVRLYFPRSVAPSIAPAKGAAQPGPTRHGRILLVEDDPPVRQSVASCLRSLGYSVVEAENGEQALDILGQDLHIELLLTDHLMPGISGLELVRAARRSCPDLATAVMTGHVAAAAIEREEDTPLVIMKPFTLTELAQGTDTALLARRRFRQERRKQESI